MMQRIWIPFFLVLCMMGCGFHLRQPMIAYENLPNFLQIESKLKNPQWQHIVRAHLMEAGFRVSDQAPVTLVLVALTEEERPYTYTALAKVAEYQLTQTLQYQLMDAHQQTMTPIIQIYTDRIYPFDERNISGSQQEKVLIQTELTNALLQQLTEQLNQTLKYLAS